jgi:hypothetical protein
MRQDTAGEWHLLKQDGAVDLTIDQSRLPYMAQSPDAEIDSVMFLARVEGNPASFTVNVDGTAVNLARQDDFLITHLSVISNLERYKPAGKGAYNIYCFGRNLYRRMLCFHAGRKQITYGLLPETLSIYDRYRFDRGESQKVVRF